MLHWRRSQKNLTIQIAFLLNIVENTVLTPSIDCQWDLVQAETLNYYAASLTNY